MDFLEIIIVSLLLTIASVPLAIKLAKKFNLMDDPNLRPHPAHIHGKPIPRAGGIPIYISILISSLLFLPIEKYLIGILLGLTILLTIGLTDDRVFKFNPYFRLVLLFLAATAAVASGIGISFVSNPLIHLNIANLNNSIIHLDQIILSFELFGPHKIVPIADLVALFWIVSLTQIINWAKGVDGQMPGITLVAAITLALFSLKLYSQGDINQLNVAKLALIVAGSSLGFLIFNWPPAKIFPGFSGSTILAFMLATLSILSGTKLATALLVLAIPAIDFIYTFFRRILNGRSPVWADRGHLHHKLLDLGWSAKKISLFYVLTSAILGTIAINFNTESKLFAFIIVAVIFLIFVLWINSFGRSLKPPDPDNG